MASFAVSVVKCESEIKEGTRKIFFFFFLSEELSGRKPGRDGVLLCLGVRYNYL